MEAHLETMMERLWNFGELKIIFRIILYFVIIGLTKSGRAAWQQEEEDKRKDFQHCADSSGTILYFQALQGHSGRNLIDPSLQDNVIIPNNFFEYIYHIGCAINLHSIINSGLIPGGRKLSKRQYSFCLWILWTKNTRILKRSTWGHRVLHKTCTKHGRNIKIRCIGST